MIIIDTLNNEDDTVQSQIYKALISWMKMNFKMNESMIEFEI